MAWEVNFDHKIGELVSGGFVQDIYESNGFLATYHIVTFPADNNRRFEVPHFLIINEDHMRNILGLTPGYRNLMEGRVTRITLYKKQCPNWELIASLFRQGMKEIEIELLDQ